MTCDYIESPIDEIYRIRQEISAQYDHDPDKLYHAMAAKQKERARQGQVCWGYNAAGELAPLPMEAVLRGASKTTGCGCVDEIGGF